MTPQDFIEKWHVEAELDPGETDVVRPWSMPDAVSLETIGEAEYVVSTFPIAGAAPPAAARMKATNRTALSQFVALEKLGSAARVRNFVRAHGPLHVLPNGYPGSMGLRVVESVQTYRDYAGLLAAVLRSAERARVNQNPLEPDLLALRSFMDRWFDSRVDRQSPMPWRSGFPSSYEFFRPRRQNIRASDLSAALLLWVNLKHENELPRLRRHIVMGLVNWWLEIGDVRPVLLWRESTPTLEWTGGLWATIGTQLLQVVRRELGDVACAHCGRRIPPSTRERKPKAGQKAWCQRAECKAAAIRERKRRSRAKPG